MFGKTSKEEAVFHAERMITLSLICLPINFTSCSLKITTGVQSVQSASVGRQMRTDVKYRPAWG